MHDISAREFGEMQATVRHLSESVDKLEVAVEKLTEVIAELQGGKKIIIGAAALIAAIAGALGWLSSHFKFTP